MPFSLDHIPKYTRLNPTAVFHHNRGSLFINAYPWKNFYDSCAPSSVLVRIGIRLVYIQRIRIIFQYDPVTDNPGCEDTETLFRIHWLIKMSCELVIFHLIASNLHTDPSASRLVLFLEFSISKSVEISSICRHIAKSDWKIRSWSITVLRVIA